MSAQPSPAPAHRLVRAGPGDLLAIHRLERIVFGLDAYDPLSLALLLLWPGNVNLKAVGSTGQLVGHVAGSPRPLSDMGWIVTLAVAPEYQRRGIGQALLAACEAQLGRPAIRLTVRASNYAAIALYRETGYRQVRVWRRYYRGGEDGLVMEKRRAILL